MQIVVDRETVWSKMVSDRRREDAQLTVVEHGQHASEKHHTLVRTRFGSLRVPNWLSGSAIIFVLAVVIMVVIIQVQPFEREEESNCLAMLLFCTILWATEVSRFERKKWRSTAHSVHLGNPTLRNQFLRPVLDRRSPAHPLDKR